MNSNTDSNDAACSTRRGRTPSTARSGLMKGNEQ